MNKIINSCGLLNTLVDEKIVRKFSTTRKNSRQAPNKLNDRSKSHPSLLEKLEIGDSTFGKLSYKRKKLPLLS